MRPRGGGRARGSRSPARGATSPSFSSLNALDRSYRVQRACFYSDGRIIPSGRGQPTVRATRPPPARREMRLAFPDASGGRDKFRPRVLHQLSLMAREQALSPRLIEPDCASPPPVPKTSACPSRVAHTAVSRLTAGLHRILELVSAHRTVRPPPPLLPLSTPAPGRLTALPPPLQRTCPRLASRAQHLPTVFWGFSALYYLQRPDGATVSRERAATLCAAVRRVSPGVNCRPALTPA